jgi:peptidyl-prolyl cis-trans isomerase-like 4
MSVVIETTIGQFTVDLFLKERPKASLNFLKLCKLKYYNFNLFHSIQAGFIAQTGDPTGEGGNGGESIWGLLEGKQKKYFEAETVPKIRHSEPGLLSMVSAGKDLISSQFLLTLGPDLTSLDGVHCVIGEVVEGKKCFFYFVCRRFFLF